MCFYLQTSLFRPAEASASRRHRARDCPHCRTRAGTHRASVETRRAEEVFSDRLGNFALPRRHSDDAAQTDIRRNRGPAALPERSPRNALDGTSACRRFAFSARQLSCAASRSAIVLAASVSRPVASPMSHGSGDRARRRADRSRACAVKRGIRNAGNQGDGRTHGREC